jgi:hypothetical protein
MVIGGLQLCQVNTYNANANATNSTRMIRNKEVKPEPQNTAKPVLILHGATKNRKYDVAMHT